VVPARPSTGRQSSPQSRRPGPARPVIPLYIHDGGPVQDRGGAASLWWLDKSLRALDESLQTRGSRLILRSGDSEAELRRLIGETGAGAVFLNRRFEPELFARDADIAHSLKAENVEVRGWNGTLMCRPGGVLNGSGSPYKVFTPFLKSLLAAAEPPAHTTGPRRLDTPAWIKSESLDGWGLHPSKPDWSTASTGRRARPERRRRSQLSSTAG
jgi:deoxyribodipyrimidine photo-lyase